MHSLAVLTIYCFLLKKRVFCITMMLVISVEGRGLPVASASLAGVQGSEGRLSFNSWTLPLGPLLVVSGKGWDGRKSKTGLRSGL